MTRALAATTRAMPVSCSGVRRWPSTSETGQGGRGRLEAEQDAEDPRAQVPQRHQLERVGQHRGQHGDAQALGDGSPVQTGRSEAERQHDHQRDRHGEGQAVELRELAPGPPLARMYAAQQAPASAASPSPVHSRSAERASRGPRR